jgi:hypothetical protein
MLKKSVIALIAFSFVIAEVSFFASRPAAAENREMLELASVLPESDIVLAMDFDRTLNVAAAGILNNDPEKIEHLKSVMKNVENQIGLSPYDIKQVALGIKLPPGDLKASAAGELDFAAIVRTRLPNTNLLETWGKRMESILAFNREKAPTRFYIDEFRRFRDLKLTRATPEKITARAGEFEAALKKMQEIAATLDALPKTSVAPGALADLRKSNQEFAATIGKLSAALRADTDTKDFRTQSIKLLNRWNALAIDDPQRSAKLAAIRKESETIFPVYQKKFEAAQKIDNLFEKLDEFPFDGKSAEPEFSLDAVLGGHLSALKNLPATKIKRTAALQTIGGEYLLLQEAWSAPLLIVTAAELVAPVMSEPEPKPLTKTPKGFSELLKEVGREQTVNGKKLIVIDIAKLNPPPEPEPEPVKTEKTEKRNQATAVAENTDEMTVETTGKKEPNLAVGYLDETRLVIGFEKSVTAVLKQDAAYRNQKAATMLETGKTALFAFAVSSTVAKKVSEEMTKTAAPSMFDNFIKDVNLYGSVNFDGENNVTNDITMTLGFARENVAALLPAPAAANNAETDSTFDIGGFQVGKALFYDLFNSFKAMQASVTFKFEKKKVASLFKSTPRILDNLSAGRRSPSTAKTAKTKPRRIDSVEELLTAPQIYIDLFKIFTEKTG